VLVWLLVTYTDGEPETYVLPLTTGVGPERDPLLAETPQALICRLVPEGGGADGWAADLLDGGAVPEVFETLLGVVVGRRRLRGERDTLTGSAENGLRAHLGLGSGRRGRVGPDPLPARPSRAEQSNSSAFFGDRAVLKLYRTLEEGPTPDLEVSRFLTRRRFPHVAPVLGSIAVRREGGASATLAMVQAWVPNEGDLWTATRESVEAYLEACAAEPEAPDVPPVATTALLELARAEPPALAYRLLGPSLEMGRLLGERMGQLHRALASDPDDPAFAPEPMAPFHLRAIYQSIRTSANEALALLQRGRSTLTVAQQSEAELVLAARPRLEERLRALLQVPSGGQRIRVHGDLHLGQMLDTGADVVFLDFEGEPARPLSERRLKRPALTDVAGMIRSFHYAAQGTRLERERREAEEPIPAALATWCRFWYRSVAAACLGSYRATTVGASFLPGDDTGFATLLDALLLAKAAYELRYELGSRPDWVGVPLAGLADLLGAGVPAP
jgi:trehalose synthase-fused probable maltokinase